MKRYALLILTIMLLAPMLPLMSEKSDFSSPEVVHNTIPNTSSANILNFSEVDFDIGRDVSLLMLVDWWQSPYNRSAILLFETGESPSYSSFSNDFTSSGDFILIKVDENGTVYQEQILQRTGYEYTSYMMKRYSYGGFESLTVVDENTIFLSGTFYTGHYDGSNPISQRLYDVNYTGITGQNAAAIVIAKLNRTTLAMEDSRVFPTLSTGGGSPCRIEAYPSTKTDGNNVSMRFAMYRPVNWNPNSAYCEGVTINGNNVGHTKNPVYQYHGIYQRPFVINFEKDFSNISAYNLPFFKSQQEYHLDLSGVNTYSGYFEDENYDAKVIIGNNSGYIELNHTECEQYGGVSWVSERFTAITCTREIAVPANPVLDVEHVLLVIDIVNQTLTEHSLGIRTNDDPSTIHQLFGDNILLYINCGPSSPCREFGLATTEPFYHSFNVALGTNQTPYLISNNAEWEIGNRLGGAYNPSETAIVRYDMQRNGQTMVIIDSEEFWFMELDNDLDDVINLEDVFPNDITQQIDTDNDGYGDNMTGNLGDACPSVNGSSFIDRFGCEDSDLDGYSNLGDQFPLEVSQYIDSDSDGFGDNQSGFRGDNCPQQFGESDRDLFGCPDSDGDGYSNNADNFPLESSQWNDTDYDGYGDEFNGYQGDACPNQHGNSTNDRYGCVDDDGDGWSNAGDDFINNPTQYSDLDGDGYGDNQSVGATMSDAFPNDGTQWNDTDGDGHGDNPYGNQGDKFPNDPTKWQDTDDDGYANEDDAFVNDATQWNDSDGDGYGDEANGNRPDAFPNDPLEWQDSDGDGYGNNADAFPVDGTQWNDTDGDGHGDNPYGTQGDWFPDDPNRWQDSDRDGYADEDDLFPNDITQWNDTDGDGYGDNLNGNNGDVFPDDSTEWKDSDEDGVGNNADQYPYDQTQTVDSDGDGYGDNTDGTRGDAFPQDDTEWSDIDSDGYGDNSDLFPSDGTQWSDTDGDGYGDNINGNRGDVFPQDSSEWSDIDNDGYGDNSDLFLTDGTQWNDTDGDGFGDNLNGANGDACPLISGNSSIILLGCVDTDGDGYADQIDAFISDALSWSDVDGDSIPDELDAYPNDATQSLDSDGDGFGDNPLGTNADKFPNDATQWNDIDGDGYGDNLDGNNPDLFITDGTQWADSDGDGYGDNPQGRLYDMFPDNPTQWLDEDGDGLGDNQSGTDADPFLNDFDNDGFNDAIDILPKLSSPGDLDADGCLDEVDAFPENPQECVDTDNDGVGDNADSDDDDDGWTDADEIRLNADPLSASNQPVDSFEIVIPGTAVGLGAWDLIGIFGGVPLFAWLAFGFSTRNGRCDKYEELLRQATSRDELEQVALRWEYSLMLRMIGPHQGIRLERLRSELDDKFEFGGNTEPEDIGVNQTSLVEREAKELPPIEAKSETQSTPPPSKDTPATSTDDEGYEWLNDESGIDWYRAADSGDDWAKFES